MNLRPLPKLSIIKQQALEKLKERTREGQKLLNINLLDENSLELAKYQRSLWNDLNYDILIALFKDQSVADDYIKELGAVIDNRASLDARFNGFEKDVKKDLHKLQSILQRIEFMNDNGLPDNSSPRNSKNLDIDDSYIEQSIISRFLEKNGPFNYKKLIQLLTELNNNFKKKNVYASAALIRATLDHIPPLLRCNSFESIVRNYSWTKSHGKYMEDLLGFKNSADDVLHTRISDKEDHFSFVDLPERVKINTLLEECIARGGSSLLPSLNKFPKDKTGSKDSLINFSLEQEKITWADYSVGNYHTWDCFRLVLFIDNFKNTKNDYINVILTAKSNDGTWLAKYYVYVDGPMESATIKANEDYKIEAGERKKVAVFISDREYGNANKRTMPDFDKDTLYLKIKTASGENTSLHIKPAWIQNG